MSDVNPVNAVHNSIQDLKDLRKQLMYSEMSVPNLDALSNVRKLLTLFEELDSSRHSNLSKSIEESGPLLDTAMKNIKYDNSKGEEILKRVIGRNKAIKDFLKV